MNNAVIAIGQTLLKLAQVDRRIIVLSADLTDSMRVSEFKKNLPGQFIDVGVAEQNMAGVAAGLALAGKIPYIFSFSIFSPGNNWLMIRNICISNLNVRIVGGLAGFGTTFNGSTHQVLEDIALTRVLPNMSVISPADGLQASTLVEDTLEHSGPIYIRVSRENVTDITANISEKTKLGKIQILKDGSDLALISTGHLITTILDVANQLEMIGVSTKVINVHTIKPFDTDSIKELFKQTKAVISVEDHQVAGGLGSMIAECIAQTHNQTPFKIIAVEDKFGESGTIYELQQKHQLTAPQILETAKKLLKM